MKKCLLIGIPIVAVFALAIYYFTGNYIDKPKGPQIVPLVQTGQSKKTQPTIVKQTKGKWISNIYNNKIYLTNNGQFSLALGDTVIVFLTNGVKGKAFIDTTVVTYNSMSNRYDTNCVGVLVDTMFSNYDREKCLVFYGYNDVSIKPYINNVLTSKDSVLITNWAEGNRKKLVEQITDDNNKLAYTDSVNPYYEISHYLNKTNNVSYYVVNSFYYWDSPYREYGQAMICTIFDMKVEVIFEENWVKTGLESDMRVGVKEIFSMYPQDIIAAIVMYAGYESGENKVYYLPPGTNNFIEDNTFVFCHIE